MNTGKQVVSYLITDNNITVNYDGQTHIVKRSEVLADQLIQAVREQRMDEIPNLVSLAKRIENQSKGTFKVQDGRVLVNGVPAPSALSAKIIRFSDEGLPYEPLVHFAEKLQLNPSFRAVNELFSFLEKNDHPLTESGNFLAFKRVKGDFLDIHSGTMDNHPGNTLEMPRNQVNEDCTQTCSIGLHVANWDYAHTQFASSNPDTDIMLEVEVDPADVVSVPVDYNNAKMRVCKYLVRGVVKTPFEPREALRFDDRDLDKEVDDLLEQSECPECGEELDEPNYCEVCGEVDEYPYHDELDGF